MATLHTAALNLLRVAGFRSIRAGIQAVMHDIAALLAMAQRRQEPDLEQDFESALPEGRLDDLIKTAKAPILQSVSIIPRDQTAVRFSGDPAAGHDQERLQGKGANVTLQPVHGAV
jgi:hypothetical protein